MLTLALLAGGLATRLRPLTSGTPKSMIEVAGEPFIAHQLRLFARVGIQDVVVCTGHLGDQIKDFVGNGAPFGCRVRYSADGETLLGTGGALRRALPLLGTRFYVVYGDSYLDTDYAAIDRAFRKAALPALMTVFRNQGRWDTSNVEFDGGVIRRYDKADRSPAMEYIDWGLGVIDAEALGQRPVDEPFDLAEFYRDLAASGRLAGYKVEERFYEIGSPDGLAETDAHLRRMLKPGPR